MQESKTTIDMNRNGSNRRTRAMPAKWRRSLENVKLIGAIDQGTSSTRFLVFESGSGRLLASSHMEVKRITPQEGWVEMDPDAIMASVNQTIEDVCRKLAAMSSRSPSPADSESGKLADYEDAIKQIRCIGICNQRESTVVWDSTTGKALYNVIIWMDNRTKDIVDQMIDSTPGRDFNFLKDKTGLPMSTYFSAFKLRWLIDNVPQVKTAMAQNRLMFGTVDSWILWNLTGHHLTDVTNASRTFLMDIETLNWDKQLCKRFNIPMKILPKILASADSFGSIQRGPLKGLPITGVIGDQSAALFGHNCLLLGQTKATFGTGCFIMQNIGPGPLNGALQGVNRDAKRGLITTVGFKLGDKPACYALEGSIKIAGAALTWMRDNMQLIRDYDECDQLINKTTSAAGVFFVPALSGLYSPYWDSSAAGIFIGLSQFTRREHLVRATLDAIAFQTNDILSLMRGVTNGLMIDGGLCKSDNMCQILADITGYDIVRPSMCETSALGAAMVAGCGANIWPYEQLLDNSQRVYEFQSQSQHNHYPQESLYYEDKFSSLMQSKKSLETAASLQARASTANLDAGGGSCDDDAGGGLPRLSPVLEDNHADEGDDESSQADIAEEDDSGAITTSGDFTAASGDEAGSMPKIKFDLAEEQSLTNSITTISTTNEPGSVTKLLSHHHIPSSGYSSADNQDQVGQITSTSHNKPPVSSSSLSSASSSSTAASLINIADNHQTTLLLNVQNKVAPISQNNLVSNFISKTFPTDLSKHICNYINLSDQLDPPSAMIADLDSDETVDDIACDSSEEVSQATLIGREDGYNSSTSFRSAQMCNPMIIKPVDVFQSYISCEHRTELVTTWKLAVERSMKWTKIQHEEIRKIDYQRLSSLPISMFLFFSIGMVALSGLFSAGRGFISK